MQLIEISLLSNFIGANRRDHSLCIVLFKGLLSALRFITDDPQVTHLSVLYQEVGLPSFSDRGNKNFYPFNCKGKKTPQNILIMSHSSHLLSAYTTCTCSKR